MGGSIAGDQNIDWQQISGSAYGVDRLKFGDFDGDGITDVFHHDEIQWFVSLDTGESESIDKTHQSILTSSYGVDELAFGDFNDDGTTDVFRGDGSKWYVSYSADTNEVNDTLTGGADNDNFAFTTQNEGVVTISDFSHIEEDKIMISESTFGATSRDPDSFSYDAEKGELSFKGNHFATLNIDSGLVISEDIDFV